MGLIGRFIGGDGSDFVKVENSQRFNYMLQQMQSNRWKITLLVLFTFFFIVFGIVLSVMFKAPIQENWKEMLLILLGAFVGNLNKVIDFWFSNEDRDKLLVQKMDEEDDASGTQKYNILEKSSSEKKTSVETPIVYPTEKSVGDTHVAESEPIVEEPIVEDEEPLADEENYSKNRWDNDDEEPKPEEE